MADDKADKRPPIPEPLKRELRQEAYFGCVLCGNPIIQYHHIIPYSEVKCHEKENLTSLCLEDHFRVTCGEISSDMIIDAKNNPYNRGKDKVRKNFILGDYKNLKINAGSVTFLRTAIPIRLHGEPLLTIKSDKSGNALLGVKLYDVKNELLAEIIDNEWIAHNPEQRWDIIYSPGHLKINSGKNKILLEFKINGDSVDLRANMFYKKTNINITPEYILWSTNKIKGSPGCNMVDNYIGFDFT